MGPDQATSRSANAYLMRPLSEHFCEHSMSILGPKSVITEPAVLLWFWDVYAGKVEGCFESKCLACPDLRSFP